MKNHLLSIVFLLGMFTPLLGQKITTVEFDTIKKHIEDNSSTYYYPRLLERFVKGDTTLYFSEYECIYYGTIFSAKYRPYGGYENEDKFFDYYRKGKYKKAIPFGEKILAENPVNLSITFKMIVCYSALNNPVKAQLYADRYFPLLDVVYNSGDGKSLKTAYVVVNVDDEYEILADLELSNTAQRLVGYTDILTLDMNSQKTEEKISEMFFNVTKPLLYLNSGLK